MNDPVFPLGKLSAAFMADLLSLVVSPDRNVLLGPGTGLDCAVLDLGGETLLVLKSDPITFTAENLGWYLVQINANDIATTGATPRWLMTTLLLPEARTTGEMVRRIFLQLKDACDAAEITIIGGHTEVTRTLDRPVAVGTMIGEVPRAQLVTPGGVAVGDVLLITKSAAIEAVAILCSAFPERLKDVLGPADFKHGLRYHLDPGISILREARIALDTGTVNAMHDPTEGGLAGALWELSDASDTCLHIDLDAVPVSQLAHRVCREFQLNPLAAISSGALLLSVPDNDHQDIVDALRHQHIPCAAIGRVRSGAPGVWVETPGGKLLLQRPERDEIARLFDD